MTAKNSRARHRRFLSNGFFPPELPPCFYSEHFAKARNYLLSAFSKIPKDKNGNPAYFSHISHLSRFNFPRFKDADRQHSIINPINFFFLSHVLSENFVKLRSISNQSSISLSRSVFDWTGERALQRPNFEKKDEISFELSVEFEWFLHTDIQRFYHSIYTHSIPWAIHGKSISKRNRKPTLVGNLIDLLVRNAQDGQTVGLPVGPDTSRMIAELVGSAIDVTLQKSVSRASDRAIRMVDDFTVGCLDKREAETILAIVRRATNGVELELNHKKTEITPITSILSGSWKGLAKDVARRQLTTDEEVRSYIHSVGNIAENNIYSNSTKYIFRNSRNVIIRSMKWPYIETFLIASYKENSSLIDVVVELIAMRHGAIGDVNINRISKFIENRLPMLFEQRRNGEAYWLLFLLTALSGRIKASALKGWMSEDDGAMALMIADADKRGLLTGKVDYSHWNKSLTVDGLNSEMWLYSYHAALSNLGADQQTDAHLRQHAFFGQLRSRDIKFYRSGEGVQSLEISLRARQRENISRLRMIEALDDDIFEFEIGGEDYFGDEFEDVY